jgi:DNA processing protein
MGSALADQGCVVVSGLALGVDGAAHRGALDADGEVIGVVGTGLDVPYPRSNGQLWQQVIDHGLLLSEFPLRTKPARWQFPARNRLIAGLGSGVVVVESHGVGGALSTVDEAAERGRPVMAVPGSVLSPASDGSNALLVDGAVPVRHAADVLGHLGVPSSVADQPGAGHRSADPVALTLPGLSTSGETRPTFRDQVLAEVGAGAVHIDRLVAVTGLSVAEVAARLEALRAEGVVVVDGSTVALPTPD